MCDAFVSSGVRSMTVSATHDGFMFSADMFYSPFATVPTGGPLDV